MNHLSQERGMSLIEIMIAMAILASLSIMTTRMLFQAYKDKLKVELKIESASYVESIRSLIVKDISKAFHHRDVNNEIYNSVQQKRKNQLIQKRDRAREQGKKNEALRYEKEMNSILIRSTKKLTHFIGDKDSLYFTSAHHRRMVKDSQTSDLVEVGYFVKSCRKRGKDKVFKSCLWRSVSDVLDDDLKKGGVKRVLLEDVKKIHFSYSREGSDIDERSSWKEKWRSDHLGNFSLRGKFPAFVKVFIEFQDPFSKKENKVQTLNFMVPIHFPNNDKMKEKR